MNSLVLKVCAKQLGLWCILVISVVLLTLLFTVLGTITCAVLTGMMMAAARHQRWQTIPVSAVFPGVVIALVQLAKVELAGTQRIYLPALCFGAFWLTYFLTRALIRFEAKPSDASDAAAPSRLKKVDSQPVSDLQLQELQGKWVCESNGHNPTLTKRILEVAGSDLSLRVIESDGQPRLVAKAHVKLESPPPSEH